MMNYRCESCRKGVAIEVLTNEPPAPAAWCPLCGARTLKVIPNNYAGRLAVAGEGEP